MKQVNESELFKILFVHCFQDVTFNEKSNTSPDENEGLL